MGDALMWTLALVAIASSLAISTVTLLVVSQLRDIDSARGATELAASGPHRGARCTQTCGHYALPNEFYVGYFVRRRIFRPALSAETRTSVRMRPRVVPADALDHARSSARTRAFRAQTAGD